MWYINLLYLLTCVLIIFWSPAFRLNGLSAKTSAIFFIIKIAVGFLFYFIYKLYYNNDNTSDAIRFYNDALALNEIRYTDLKAYLNLLLGFDADSQTYYPHIAKMSNWVKPWNYGLFNDNRIIIRFNALLLLISAKQYYAHIILANFISYIGFKWIHQYFYHFYKNYSSTFIIAVLVFMSPSTLFWGSGVLKEVILFFLLGMFLKYLLKIYNQFSLINFVFLLVVLISFLWVKVYLMPALIIYAFWILFNKYIFINSKKATLISIFAASIGLIFCFQILFSIDVFEILRQKQFDFINYALRQKAGSFIVLQAFDGTFLSFIVNIPSSIYNTLCLPTMFQLSSAFMYLNFIENLIFLTLCIYMIFYFNRLNKELRMIAIGNLLFVFALAIVIGFSTPVIGAIVRYKVPLIPFLLVTIVSCIDIHSPLKLFINKWEKKLRL